MKLSPKERSQKNRLNKKWSCGTATRKEILRAMELNRKAEFEESQFDDCSCGSPCGAEPIGCSSCQRR